MNKEGIEIYTGGRANHQVRRVTDKRCHAPCIGQQSRRQQERYGINPQRLTNQDDQGPKITTVVTLSSSNDRMVTVAPIISISRNSRPLLMAATL